ncbi:MAG: DUF3048 domain-containing protein [Anaerolineae bacterium]
MRQIWHLSFILLWVVACHAACTGSTTPSSSQNISENQRPSLEVSPSLHIITPLPSTATPLPGTLGPRDFPPGINPLTGLPVDDPAVLERRPIVVKISNAPPLVRPQAGIGAADVVFEHYAEGGLTRFSAVFYSQAPTRVGSIRSARLIDHELVPMFDGMLAFSGASIGVEKYIYGSEAVVNQIPGAEQTPPLGLVPPSEYAERAYKGVAYGLPYYWRDESVPVPHNLFTNLEALWQLAATQGHNQRPTLQGLAFHPAPPSGSTGGAARIDLRYRATRVLWTYDAESGLYRRSADGQGHFDANTEEQITAANVVVLYIRHNDTDIVESQFENSISYSTQIAIWGAGEAVLFRDGQRYDGQWVRPVREEIIGLRTDAGDLLPLKPGTTFFQIVRLPTQQNPQEEWLIVENTLQ